jgi:hypothetical protein
MAVSPVVWAAPSGIIAMQLVVQQQPALVSGRRMQGRARGSNSGPSIAFTFTQSLNSSSSIMHWR